LITARDDNFFREKNAMLLHDKTTEQIRLKIEYEVA